MYWSGVPEERREMREMQYFKRIFVELKNHLKS
jgi:hypothetical protein